MGVPRKWIRPVLWVAGFACLWLNVHDDPPLVSGAVVLEATPDRVAFGVIAARPVAATASLRNAAGGELAREIAARPVRRHEFEFAGLAAGTLYECRIELGDGRVESARVRTAPVVDEAPVRFAFLGDSGDQPWWVWLQRTPALHWPARWGWFADTEAVSQVGAAVAAYAPDFMIHLGDVVYPRGQHAHYAAGFFRPFAGVVRQAPTFAVLGNHDVMESGGLQLLANLRPRRWLRQGDGRNLSVAWGPLRVIGLDANTDFTGDVFDADHPSCQFLERELTACSEPWIVVATHFPICSASRQRDSAQLMLNLLPVLRRHQVSLYLSGHDHCYQRFAARGGDPPLIVSGGGGKDLYDVRPHPRAVRVVSAHHWCSAELRGSACVIRAHGLDGSCLDEVELRLPEGEELAAVRARAPARAARIERLLRDAGR